MKAYGYGRVAFLSLMGPLFAEEAPPLRPGLGAERQSSQYFGRGFDLSEGSAFAYALDGIPLNLPSALQGPGFMDDGILIPETIGGSVYRKGPFGSDQGAFAIAGSAELETKAAFDRPMAKLEYGGADSDRFGRALWAGTHAAGLTCALEATHSYRPWDEFWQSAKVNGLFRLAPADPARGWTFTMLATDERGDGGSPRPDRPLPAEHQEDFDDLRLGNGYRFQRVFVGLRRSLDRGAGVTDRQQLYAGASTMRNWVNATYALRNPELGDQQEQLDRRTFLGGSVVREWDFRGEPVAWAHTLGAQGRLDMVSDADLTWTRQLQPWGTRMEAAGELGHGALHGQSMVRWGQGWRAFLAGRVDTQYNRVHGAQPWTRQDTLATLMSPSLGLGWSPWTGTDFQASLGQGFSLGNAFRDTRPMVRAHSAELGAQTRLAAPWVSSLTLWGLELEHESLWNPAEGAPLLQGPSRRQGLEWFNRVKAGPWQFQASLGWSRARFLEAPAGQDRVPGSIPQTAVVSLGWKDHGYALGVAFKSLGAYALNGDGWLESGRRSDLELSLHRHWRDWSAGLRVINAFNLRKHARGYFYQSQLPGEPVSVLATHSKGGDPQAIRLELTRRF